MDGQLVDNYLKQKLNMLISYPKQKLAPDSHSPSILFRAETNYCEWMHPVSSNFVISSKRATSIIIEADLALLILSSNSLTIAPEEKEACVLIDRRSREA